MAQVVLHIHALDLGGAERVALQWAIWLRDQGHQVFLLVGQQPKQAFFAVPQGITLSFRPTFWGATPGGSAVWLRRWMQDHRPDLAIGITSRPAINLLLASVGQPWPVLVAERNFPPAKLLPFPWRLLRRWLYPQAALHLVQTQRIGDWLAAQGLAKKLAVLPNPVLWPLPVQEPVLDPDAWMPPTAKLLLAVGTKPDQKGFDRLLAVFKSVATAHPSWWLALPGVDPQHPRLQAILTEFDPTCEWMSRLVLPGRVGNLSAWYQRASIFVLSSRYEGFPNVLVEALAAGCACVAIDCPTGPRELIQHNLNGVLVPDPAVSNQSLAGLEEVLIALMLDPARRAALGLQATTVRTALAPASIEAQFLKAVGSCLRPKVLLLAPTRRSPTETFVRANLARLPLRQVACFGDARSLYGLAIVLSKICTRLGWQRLATLPGSLAAWAFIRWHRPDVVMVEFGFHAVRVMDAALWTGVPLVVHFRGSDASADRRLRLLAERYRRLMKIASALIVKSRPMQQVLESLGASAQRITISPSGADPEIFDGAAPAAAPPRVLFVGRLVEKKGPLDALEAFSEVHARWSQSASTLGLAQLMQLVVIGDGPLRSEMEQRVATLGLQDWVVFEGLREPAEVADLMRRSRCLLLPSKTARDGDSEGCPVVVQEAQMAGLPVISTLHAGIPEVVIDGTTGFLCQEGDVQAMASAIETLLRNPDQAGVMGLAAQSHAKTHFTIDHHINTVKSVLFSVLSSNKE